MRRFLLYALLLGTVRWVVGAGVDFVGFRLFDWTFEAFCAAILVPAAQAAAVCLLTPRRAAIGLGAALRAAAVSPAVRAVLALDAFLALAGGLVPDAFGKGLAAALIVELAAAGALALHLARRLGAAAERAVLAASALAALAGAAAAVARFRLRAAAPPNLGRLVLWRALPLAAGVALVLAAASVVARRAPAAGCLLDASTAFPVAAAILAAIHLFRFPVLPPPAAAAVGALLLAGVGVAIAGIATALRAIGVSPPRAA